MTTTNNLETIGRDFASSLEDLARSYAVDYDRLEELRDLACEELKEGQEDLLTSEEREELEDLRQQAGECTSREDAFDRLNEYPLEFTFGIEACSVSDWPPTRPDTLTVLCWTGGPAARVVIDLDNRSFRLQVADWFTGWTEVFDYDRELISSLVDHWAEIAESYLA